MTSTSGTASGFADFAIYTADSKTFKVSCFIDADDNGNFALQGKQLADHVKQKLDDKAAADGTLTVDEAEVHLKTLHFTTEDGSAWGLGQVQGCASEEEWAENKNDWRYQASD